MKISYRLPNFYFQGMPKAIEEGARYCPTGKNKHTQTQNSEETTNSSPYVLNLTSLKAVKLAPLI